jgi:ATP-dependent DNA helicase RecG
VFISEITTLLDIRENSEIEWKAARGGLPKSIWETYSSFANTNGGIILLGIEERDNGYEIVGVDVEKILKEFWNNANNPQKVSKNILRDGDLSICDIAGLQVISIHVPGATREQKPVYIGQNPLNGTYRRNFDGDYKCTEHEVKSMLADQSNETRDKKILVGYGVEDLNVESVNSYRQRLSSRNPNHPFLASEFKEFLFEIGAWGKSRQSNEEGLTVAGLLMFGKERAITDEFPHYFLDYREFIQTDGSQRWSHRITSAEGTWSGNLYDFYFKVVHPLMDNINIPFKLDGLIRKDETNVHIALREALINALVHADYYGERGIVIEKYKTLFRFANPGTVRVSVEQALRGGVSDPRNANLFKMFTLLGIGERAGSGVLAIQTAWKQQHWRAPELVEELQPDRTVLILRTVSLLPTESIQYLKMILGEKYNQLSRDEIFMLVTAHLELHVTNSRLQTLLQQPSNDLTRLLQTLVEKDLLVSEGKGRGTKYILSSIFPKYDEASIEDNDESIQHNEESSQHSEVSIQHNEESSQHSEVSIQHNEDNKHEDIWLGSELNSLLSIVREKSRVDPKIMEDVILRLCSEKPQRTSDLAQLLNRKIDTIRNHYIGPLVQSGKLKPIYSDPTHPTQAYMTVNN